MELLSVNPTDRPTSEQALNHPWFTLEEGDVPNDVIRVRRANSIGAKEDAKEQGGKLPDTLMLDLSPLALHTATQKEVDVAVAEQLHYADLKRHSMDHHVKPLHREGSTEYAHLVASLKERQDRKRQKKLQQLR